MKVILINPPWFVLMGMSFEEIPIGLAYLASSLRVRGHDVRLFNADAVFGGRMPTHQRLFKRHEDYKSLLNDTRHRVWDGVKEQLRDFRPNVVGIHMKTPQYRSALNVAVIAKELNPSVKVVLGGPHPTILPEEVASQDGVDFVVAGEGEETLVELCEALEKGKDPDDIDGIVFRRNGAVVRNRSRRLIEDLDSLPFPERERIVDKRRYPAEAFGLIFTARGCPFQCTYCASHQIWTRKVRFRSPENVVAEIKHVRETYGTNYFKFSDDTFTVNMRRALRICELIISERIGIEWQCYTRADCVTEELAKAMNRAGCREALIGVESGSDRILEMTRKGETTEGIRRGIDFLKNAGVGVHVFVMMGFPTETASEVKETMEFAKSLGPISIVANILTPYPGTEVFNDAIKQGFIDEDVRYELFFHQSPVMGLSRAMTEEEFARMKAYFIGEANRYNRRTLRSIKLRRRLRVLFKDPLYVIRRAVCRMTGGKIRTGYATCSSEKTGHE